MIIVIVIIMRWRCACSWSTSPARAAAGAAGARRTEAEGWGDPPLTGRVGRIRVRAGVELGLCHIAGRVGWGCAKP
eukprot:scaffold146_cov374-Prasinococcus_capsulatus_cf.AAC.16